MIGRFSSCLRFSLVASLFGAVAVPALAAEKTYSRFRFTPTRLRDGSASNSVQVSEFRLRLRGANLDMTKATVTNPDGSSPAAEGPARLTDGNTATKWLDLNKRAVVFTFGAAVTVDGYSFSTANDSMERDPANWRLEGSNDGASWVLLDERINGSVPEARQTATGEFTLNTTVRPYMSFWHPDYLLKWTAANDTSADFNKSAVPLATRTINAALKANANARANEGKVTVLTTFGSTSFNPSQGSTAEHFNAYTGWQYTDKLVFWGGSAGEGLILAPGAPVIDAAHRNGVPVLGTVFFPPTAYGGQFHWVQTFLQKNNGTFPVADKLIEVARYYGFEGWFFNQETNGGNATDAANMRDFISYFRSKAPDLQIQWYDAMTEGGGVSWQNALNGSNDWFMSYNSQPVAHSMFLNFWWNSSGLANSRSTAQSLGVDPYSVYAAIDVESAGSGTGADWEAVFPSGQAHRTSLAFYGAQSMFRNTGNPADFQASEIRFWSGQNGDPSNTATSNSWKGIANYIPEATPLQKLPFVTNFNRGQGNRFAVEGTTLATGGWNNLSLQDVLPTWKWIVTSARTKLTPSLELDDAYSGGASLKISGTLNATNDVRLYQANLPVSAETKFRLIYKSNQGEGATSMQLALAFTDAPQTFIYLNVGDAGGEGWRTRDFDLGAYAGRRIAQIGLRFASSGVISGYQMRIGRMAVFDGAVSAPAAPTNVRVVQKDSADADGLAIRLKWDASTTAGIYYYQVIQRFPDGSRKWLGATPGNALYLPAARRAGLETALTLEVQAVGADFGISEATTLTVPLLPADVAYPLAGTWIGTPGSWSNQGDTGDKAFDGNTATYFDAQEESAWTGRDFGAGKAKRITAIRYFPRMNWAYRTTGGVFEGANQADFSDAVLLHTVATEPPNGAYTTVPVARTEMFRYFRFRSNGHGNIAEIQIFGYEAPGAVSDLAAELSPAGAALTWKAGAWATGYRVERGDSAAGPFTAVGEAAGLAFSDATAPVSSRPYYRIVTLNPLGEIASAAVRSLPGSAFYAWQLEKFSSGAGAEVTAAEADPDGDGLTNLMEYALGLNPLAAEPPAVSAVLEGERIGLLYPVNPAAADVVLTAEWSDDLVTWSSEGVEYESAGEGLKRATAPAGEGRRFLRLKATGD